ncbi:hypothetical protein CLOM_g19861 [Closterium sp. NIES-68]|nr:hypothetical protein CLOM_g19861 [Closterium sp. NIES-68]
MARSVSLSTSSHRHPRGGVVLPLLAALVLLSSLHAATPLVSAARHRDHAHALAAAAIPKGQLPTRAQMLAEVDKAMAAVKKNPNYTKIASIGKALLPKAPKKYDIRQAYNSTILLGNNDAITSLMKRVPITQLDRLFQTLQYMTIRGRWTTAKLKKQGATAKFATWYGKLALQKMTAANAAMLSFGKAGSASSKWTTILTAGLYRGPYFTVHGVNYCIVV